MVFTDGDQVAEMLLSDDQHKAPRQDGQAATDQAPLDPGARVENETGRFVLVDCRPASVLKAEHTDPSVVGRRMEKAITAMGLAGGRVVWRRIDPAAFLGRESEVAAELLRGVAAARGGTEEGAFAEQMGVNGAGGVKEVPNGGGRVNGNGHGVSRDHSGDNGANGSTHAESCGSSNSNICGVSQTFTAPTTEAGAAVMTHVCFIGSGEASGDPRNIMCTGLALPNVAHHAAAVRLARAAARLGLARACILEGGFKAFEVALARRAAATAATRVTASRPGSLVGNVKHSGEGDGFAATTADAAAGTAAERSPQVKYSPRSSRKTLAAKVYPKRSTSPTNLSVGVATHPPPPMGKPRLGTSASAEQMGGGGMVARRDPRRSQSERRILGSARMASASKISEPFRVYAAKTADEMGRALRSLPATAGRPLEVRVCFVGETTAVDDVDMGPSIFDHRLKGRIYGL